MTDVELRSWAHEFALDLLDRIDALNAVLEAVYEAHDHGDPELWNGGCDICRALDGAA